MPISGDVKDTLHDVDVFLKKHKYIATVFVLIVVCSAYLMIPSEYGGSPELSAYFGVPTGDADAEIKTVGIGQSVTNYYSLARWDSVLNPNEVISVDSDDNIKYVVVVCNVNLDETWMHSTDDVKVRVIIEKNNITISDSYSSVIGSGIDYITYTQLTFVSTYSGIGIDLQSGAWYEIIVTLSVRLP